MLKNTGTFLNYAKRIIDIFTFSAYGVLGLG